MSFGLQQTRAGIGGQRRSKCGEETALQAQKVLISEWSYKHT